MTPRNVYERLNVARAINAAGTLTRLSGSLMPPEVVAAMAEAAGSFVRIDELQAAVGKRIAEITGAEAGLVTAGAAAGVTLAAAACLARDDFARMDRLPDTVGIANQIIVARSHRNGYDHALRAAGAKLVEVGVAERTRDPQRWELEAAIDEQTVAIGYAVGFSQLDLAMVVEVAHERRLPVIIDASAALPPKKHLREFIASGADLVVFSGGKGLRGPQASGILCGRRELVASAALQMWDMDWLPELWNPPQSLIPADWVQRGVPNHGIGRAMKVGKEEIVGLWAALERFVALDEQAEIERLATYVRLLEKGLAGLPGVSVHVVERPDLWPRLELTIGEGAAISAVEFVRRLERGAPPVHVGQAEADRGLIGIDPFCLQPGEAEIVAARVVALLKH